MNSPFKLIIGYLCLALMGCTEESATNQNGNSVAFEPEVQALLEQKTAIKVTLPKKPVATPTPLHQAEKQDKRDKEQHISLSDKLASHHFKAAMNTMQDSQASTPIKLTFSGADFQDGEIRSGVSVIKLNQSLLHWDGNTNPIEQVLELGNDFTVKSQGDSLYIHFQTPLHPASEYIFAVTKAITDVHGQPVNAGNQPQEHAFVSQLNTKKLAETQNLIQGIEGVFSFASKLGLANILVADIIYSSWFNTPSMQRNLSNIEQLNLSQPST